MEAAAWTRVASRDSSQRVQAKCHRLHPYPWDQLEAAFGKGACSGHTASAFSHRTAESRCVREAEQRCGCCITEQSSVVLPSAPSFTRGAKCADVVSSGHASES